MSLCIRALVLAAVVGIACDSSQEARSSRSNETPIVDPELVGSWEGRARDYGLFDPVRFEIAADGRFDVWIRNEHRPYLLQASEGRWRASSAERGVALSGAYKLKKGGQVEWWGMFATAPTMKRKV